MSEETVPEEVPSGDQFEFHLKPKGWNGNPCPICGCEARNLRARHRALKADELYSQNGAVILWVKRVKVCFGMDYDDRGIPRNNALTFCGILFLTRVGSTSADPASVVARES